MVFEAKELNYTTLDEEFLQHAIDCVNRHLDDSEFDQTQFLEEMHTTKSTCFRKLKSLTGLTYVSFIRNIRMKAACRIMEEKKNVRISDLAYAVGYNDARYLRKNSACFLLNIWSDLPREEVWRKNRSDKEDVEYLLKSCRRMFHALIFYMFGTLQSNYHFPSPYVCTANQETHALPGSK